MLKTLSASIIAATVLCGTPAMADHRNADRHGHYRTDYRGHEHHQGRGHYRGYYGGGYGVQYRAVPRYRVEPVALQYYYNEPVHYHYAESGYVAHHGDCNNAFLWIGGAMVLSEIIHHAGH